MLHWLIYTLASILCGLLASVIVIAAIYAWSAFAPLAPDTRLVLAQLALPALRQLPDAPRAAFAATCAALINADRKLSYLEYAVQKVVVGHPISHSGGSTSMSEKASAFAEKLRTRLECPVELWDERLTSAEANRMLRSAGLSIGKRQRAVDRVAAVLLLQNYLDYCANELERAGLNGSDA